jgi:hypothetical protein
MKATLPGMTALGATLPFCLVSILVFLLASPVLAQDSWGSDASDSSTQSQKRTSGTRGLDGKPFQGYDAYQGPYAQFGVTIGEIDYDGPINVDTGGGFTMTGGYRFLAWLSAEGNVTYLGGGDAKFQGTNLGDAEYFAFTFGPKIYPLGFVDQDVVPDYFQPYGLIGLGGGEFDIDGNGNFNGNSERSSFIARFIFGFDVWFTNHIGTFVEGGYHAAADDDVDGAGVFSLGGQYRF